MAIRPINSTAANRSLRLPRATQQTGVLGLTRAQGWGILFLVYTALFVLFFGYHYLDDLSRERAGTFAVRFLEEFTGVYTVFLLLPLVLRVADFYLFKVKGWMRQVVFHLVAAAGFSFLHTTFMALSRWILAPLMGLGSYDYGIMRFRFPMEFSNDLMGYTVIVLVYYFFERLRIAQAQQLAAAELQAKLAQAQLENLRLQLQPHFLFNTLNTISSVMYEDVRTADAMLTQLSELLRLTLRTANSHEIPLAQELEITRLYLQIMQKRFESNLRVTYSVDSELENSMVPQLILQPLVENSLRHGLKDGGTGIDITIGARRENGSLILQVADTGTGFGAQGVESVMNRGVGLANIRGRLEQLYGAEQEFAIANRPTGGAEVTLRVPFHVEEDRIQPSG
ncbi:MAG TPA: histidine kinase [Candidatus Acidoferrum sp.]|nr:histidine kinase [Candidatus Acidoferrum sp.]